MLLDALVIDVRRMLQTFTTTRRVPFADVDMAGFVHFPNYFRYMEETEYAFLRSLGLDVVLYDERGTYGFPRMAVQCRYLQPARYGDELTVHLEVLHNNGKSLTYGFRVLREERLLATGEMQAACCRFPAQGAPYAIPLPDRVLEQIPLADARITR